MQQLNREAKKSETNSKKIEWLKKNVSLQTSEGYYETKACMLHKSQVEEAPSLTSGQLFGAVVWGARQNAGFWLQEQQKYRV